MSKRVLWPNGAEASVVPPAPGQVSSGFRATSEYGWRTHPVTGQRDTFHEGIDLVGWTTNLSPVDGTVVRAAWFGGYGNCVDVRADDGDLFRIGHNARFLVGQGARVSAGQSVAIMGTTGNSTGVHTHFETRPGGGATVNPRDYMRAHAGGGGVAPNEEDNTMLMLKLTGARVQHVVSLDTGVFRHFVGTDPYEFIKNISRSADDWQEVNFSALPALLRTYGCDLNIWDFRDARDLSKSVSAGDVNAVFCVLDPLDGSVKPGNMWSVDNATRRAIADMQKAVLAAIPAK